MSNQPDGRDTFVFATQNKGKLAELRELVRDLPITVMSIADAGVSLDVEETGDTFAENALIKAKAAADATGLSAIADDSGLEVDALDGRPGVFSARYGGPAASDQDRINKLLGELVDVPQGQRQARFRCAIALVDPQSDDDDVVVEGTCEGYIAQEPEGTGGFGYDPVFFCPAVNKTFGRATSEEKHRVSHRGSAMRKLATTLRQRLTL